MKKKSFLSGIGAKLALAAVALTTVVFTSCEKEEFNVEPVELSPASATIVATVYDLTTGEVLAPQAIVETITAGTDGTIAATTKEISCPSFSNAEYLPVEAITVAIPKLAKGQFALIPVNFYAQKIVSAAKNVTVSEDPTTIETPADRSHGDFATNAAMAGAKAFRMPPFKIAQAITSNLDLEGTMFDRFETAGPGFINFFLGTEFYSAVIREILANPEAYGRSEYGRDEKVMVEFVSANPTGPMHMGNARGGALGDCLAAVLDKAGYNAWREFYVNDAGNQIEKFGCSLEARYLQIFKGEGRKKGGLYEILPECQRRGNSF